MKGIMVTKEMLKKALVDLGGEKGMILPQL